MKTAPLSRRGRLRHILADLRMPGALEALDADLTSNKGFEEWGEIFGDEVMAAALIDRLVHHCHLVSIRGNNYRMRQHTELWHPLHASQEPESPAARRRRSRQEAATT